MIPHCRGQHTLKTPLKGRLYFLKQLKTAGVSKKHLLHFYTTVIRPILKYCAPVWHCAPVWDCGLMRTQSQQLEAIQKRAIHVILNLSRGMSYSSMLFAMDLKSLVDRRENLSRNFFVGITKLSSSLHHLLPPQGHIPPPPPQGSGHTNNIQGSALVRNIIVHL